MIRYSSFHRMSREDIAAFVAIAEAQHPVTQPSAVEAEPQAVGA